MMNQCTICSKEFSNKSNLMRHKLTLHNYSDKKTTKPIRLKFESMTDFQEWKAKMEEETCSFYTSKHQVNTQNEKYYYYKCSRSGQYVPKGKGIRCLKSQKSSKIGKNCPARINLKLTDSALYVTFYGEHEGHGTELEHLRLPQDFRAAIACKLKEGISFQKVLDEVREKAILENNFGRKCLLTRKDLQNIKRDYNVKTEDKEGDIIEYRLNNIKKEEIFPTSLCQQT